MTWEHPLEKAIGEIGPGIPEPEFGPTAFNYSHLLEPQHEQAFPGARIIAYTGRERHDGTRGITASIRDSNGLDMGHVDGKLHKPTPDGRVPFQITSADTHEFLPAHMSGTKLYWGRKLYEAAMAHAKHHHGATHLIGGVHSSFANKAHSALAEKHGLNYSPFENIEGYDSMVPSLPRHAGLGLQSPYLYSDWDREADAPYDDKFGPYQYTLKSEEPLSFSSVTPGTLKRTSDTEGIPYAQFFDYSHLLDDADRARGYGLELKTIHPRSIDNPPSSWKMNITHPSARLLNPNSLSVGLVTGSYQHDHPHKPLVFDYARIGKDHRGRHLGRSAYEAIIAHFRQHHGAETVHGGTHSSSANVTHRAIVNKYGLSFINPPVPQDGVEWDTDVPNPDPKPYGSFDSTFGHYAYKLHRSMRTFYEGEPLLKIEEDPNDLIIQKIKNGDDYAIDTYEIRQLQRAGDWNENRTAALLKYRPALALYGTDQLMGSGSFTKDAWDYAFKGPDGKLNLTSEHAARAHRGMMIKMMQSSYTPAWVQENLLAFFNEAKEQAEYDAARPPTAPASDDDADKTADTMMLAALGGNEWDNDTSDARNAMLANPEVIASIPLSNKLGTRNYRENLVKSMLNNVKAGDQTSDLARDKLLDYGKALFANLERFTSTRTRQYRDVHREFGKVLPHLKELVALSVPDAYIKKNTTKKGLFTALLSHSPNFPKKKFETMLAALSADGAKKHKIPQIQEHMSTLLLKSPLIKPEHWASLVKAFPSGINLSEMTNDPRWTDDLSKHVYKSQDDPAIFEHLAGSDKLTPDLANWFSEQMTKHNEGAQAEIDKKVQEYQERMASQDPNDYYAVKLNPLTGRYEDPRGYSNTLYSETPFEYKAGHATTLIEQAARAINDKSLLSPILHNLFNQWEKSAFYQHHAGLHPIHMNRNYGAASHPWDLVSLAVGQNYGQIGADIHDRLAQLLVKNPWMVNSDHTSQKEWLEKAPLEDRTVQMLLGQTTNHQIIEHLMARADAKPEWIDVVQSRPEYAAVPDAAIDPRYGLPRGRYDYNNDKIGRSTGVEMHQALRNSVLSSKGLTDSQIARTIKTASFNEAQTLIENPNFGPESLNVVMNAVPTVYSTERLLDANGNSVRDAHGERVHKVATQGNVPWSMASKLENMATVVKSHPTLLTPEHWNVMGTHLDTHIVENDMAFGVINPLMETLAVNVNTPEPLLQKLWDNPNLSDEIRTTLLKNPRAKPEWIDSAIDMPFDRDRASIIIENPSLTPEQVEKLKTKAVAAIGEPLTPEGGPADRHYGMNVFWANFSKSPYGEGQWSADLYAKMQAFDQTQIANGNGAYWARSTFGRELGTNIERNNPDAAFGPIVPSVDVRNGSHKLRGVRDLIESVGGSAPIAQLPPGPNYNALQTTAPMSDEDYMKIPEKRRPPVRPNKKTGHVSSENVQRAIDEMPSQKYNISTTTYHHPGLQMHNGSVPDQVFQLNISNDTVKKLKEAGVWDTFKEVQDMLGAGQGGIHPLRSVSLGWIRHGGVTPKKTLHISEIQSDIRPPGGDWQYAWDRFSKASQKPQIIGKMAYHWDQSTFPGAKLNKMHEILFGKKGDPHHVLVEALHQHLRDQGNHDVTIHLPGSEFRGQLSGMGKKKEDLPVHYIETYDDMPRDMGYAVGASTYGQQNEPTQKNPDFNGLPVHTSPVRKYEDLLSDFAKAVGDLPEQPIINNFRDERHYDTSSYLTPEHRTAGYAMKIRSGVSPLYGNWATADLYHQGKAIGGTSAVIEHPNMEIQLSDINPEHVGKGLGLPMYEALLAHGHKIFGATHVRGSTHSTFAHRVHAKLAEKHGLKYVAKPNIGGRKYPTQEAWETAAARPYDAKFAPYRYTIDPSDYDMPHGEEPEELDKMALASVKVGRKTPPQYPNQRDKKYDYSHLLPADYKNQGYRLHLTHVGPGFERYPDGPDTGAKAQPEELIARLFKIRRVSEPVANQIRTHAQNRYPNSPSMAAKYFRELAYVDDHVGHARGFVHPDGTLEPHFNSGISADHRGKGLGKALYNAVFGHAYNALGARKVRGGMHSVQAGRVHEALSREHGMDYNADTITTPRKYQDRPSLEDAPTVRTSYDYNMKTELAKAVPVMPVPKAVPVSEHLQAYDYSHLLPNGHNSAVRMLLTHHPSGNHKGSMTVRLLDTDSGEELGSLMAHHHEQFNELEPLDAYLDKDYRRAGLGQAMYAALYTHAKNALKATHVRGGRHSSYAHRVHQNIAKEFGLDYHAKPNVGAEGYRNETDWNDTPPMSYDAKFGNYRYTLR